MRASEAVCAREAMLLPIARGLGGPSSSWELARACPSPWGWVRVANHFLKCSLWDLGIGSLCFSIRIGFRGNASKLWKAFGGALGERGFELDRTSVHRLRF